MLKSGNKDNKDKKDKHKKSNTLKHVKKYLEASPHSSQASDDITRSVLLIPPPVRLMLILWGLILTTSTPSSTMSASPQTKHTKQQTHKTTKPLPAHRLKLEHRQVQGNTNRRQTRLTAAHLHTRSHQGQMGCCCQPSALHRSTLRHVVPQMLSPSKLAMFSAEPLSRWNRYLGANWAAQPLMKSGTRCLNKFVRCSRHTWRKPCKALPLHTLGIANHHQRRAYHDQH